MSQAKLIKSKIKASSREDCTQLREWMAEKDWQHWDEQIDKDSASGKFDFLREEAMAAKSKGKLRDL